MRIQTRICGTQISGVEVVKNYIRFDGGGAISVSGNQVLVAIAKSGATACQARVQVSLMPVAAAPATGFFPCLSGNIDGDTGGSLNWFRGVNQSDGGNFVSRHALLTLVYNHPSDPCHWKNTRILGVREETSGIILYSDTRPSTDGGPIPQNEDEEWYEGADGFDGEWPQCSFVPGENLQLEWIMQYDDDVVAAIVASAWFATPAFTGGEVLSVSGEGVDKIITVNCQSSVFACMPSDFAEYKPGDWVYLLKQGNAKAEQTNRQENYGAEDTEISSEDTLRVIPARFNDFGATDGFETIDYTLDDSVNFSDTFEISEHIGSITALSTTQDAADVDIDGLGVFSDVPIFYHCEDSGTVEGGIGAFSVDDDVLVLNEDGDLTIVGFANKLQSCCFGVQVTTINGDSGYDPNLYSIQLTQPIETEVDTKGGYTKDYRVIALAALDENGVAIFYPGTFNYPIDTDFPVHAWLYCTKSKGFQYFTEDYAGAWPDVVVHQEEDSTAFIYYIDSQAKYDVVKSYDFFDICTKADTVNAILLDTDLRSVPKIQVAAASGQTVPAWTVAFTGVKNIKISIHTHVDGYCGQAAELFEDQEQRHYLYCLNSDHYPDTWPGWTCGYSYWLENIPGNCQKCFGQVELDYFINKSPIFGILSDKQGHNPTYSAKTQSCHTFADIFMATGTAVAIPGGFTCEDWSAPEIIKRITIEDTRKWEMVDV